MSVNRCQRILVAEDEGLIALQLELMLSDLNFTVIGPASSVEEVVAAVENDEFDGALLDVNLRGHSIFPVLPRIVKAKKPYIITSGYDASSLFPVEYQQVPRVAKPFDENRLRLLCEQMFACRPATGSA
jgi:DNA-binding NtrC family response regulator